MNGVLWVVEIHEYGKGWVMWGGYETRAEARRSQVTAQDFIGVESLRPMPAEQPVPKVQPWQDWADVFPRYTDGHDGPGGVVPWRRARAADTEGGEA